MICCVIANTHIMYGVDLHVGFPAIIPFPAIPFAPHAVLAQVRNGPWGEAAKKEDTTVQAPGGNVISKIFDIGAWIPHVTLPVLDHVVWMIIYSRLSSSQGHFGVGSVQTGKGPIAVALFYHKNLQLQCGTPFPTPTAVVEAQSTVVAGLTIGDLIAGFFTMAITELIVCGLDKLIGFGYNTIAESIIARLPPNLSLQSAFIAVFAEPLATTAAGCFLDSEGLISFVSKITDLKEPVNDAGVGLGAWIDKTFGSSEYFDNIELPPPFPLGP